MVDKQYTSVLPDDAATLALAAAVARVCTAGLTVYLHGELGAGKTTWVRGFLHALGYAGRVKSPTYTLVESYPLATHQVFHFDLYRLNDVEELEYMGIRDYLRDDVVCLIEWPERGQPLLPPPDIDVWLEYGEPDGRLARVVAGSDKGRALLQQSMVE
ncbi:MAG: tRNA (adenosine(37)-N6)-threonylcarbamoyltransferase complex ATPase subunit type 1 TsaE [Pseudomonadota bacterium]